MQCNPLIYHKLILTDPTAIKGIYVNREDGVFQDKIQLKLNVSGDITTINFDPQDVKDLYKFMDTLLDWMGYSQEQKEEIQRNY